MNKPSDDEISAKRDDAASAAIRPSKYPSMTYEEGVRNALEWVMGEYEGDLDV